MNVSHETSLGNNPNCIYKYWYVYHNVSHETLPSMFKVCWRDCAENVSCETFQFMVQNFSHIIYLYGDV